MVNRQQFLLRIIVVGFLLSGSIAPSIAQDTTKPVGGNERHEIALESASLYFQNLKAAQGRFTQISMDGRQARGTFYFKQPGKMKFFFDAPNSQIIIADGRWLNIQEGPGAEANRFPLKASPLGQFLTSPGDIQGTGMVREIELTDSRFYVLLAEEDSLEGSLKLTFTYPSMALRGWRVVDIQGQTTDVILRNFQPVADLPNSLFFVDENESDDY